MVSGKKLVPIFLAVCIGVLNACSGQNEETAGQDSEMDDMMAGDHSAHMQMDMGSDEPSDESLYNVTSQWQTRYGHEIQLDSLRGKVQVVAMVYTHCDYACPRIVADMKRIAGALSENEMNQTNFVLISIDPERDTPERLRRFAEENEMDDEHWTLLQGNSGDILEMAALLGVRYRRISETDFTHSNMITVLNKAGEAAYQQKTLTDSQEQTINTIRQAVSE